MELRELLARNAHFSWMPDEGLNMLDDCFGLTVETVPAGEMRENAGRIGYVLQGTGKRLTETGEESAAAGTLLGIAAGGPQGHHRTRDVLTAETDCTVLWFPYDLMEFACHRNCWFHTRMILEVRKMIGDPYL